MLPLKLLWQALFLSEPAYDEMRQSAQPFLRGLLLILVVALVVALAGLVGEVLHWATSPNIDQVQQIVRQGIERMPWYQDLRDVPAFVQQFNQGWNLTWRLAPLLFGAPSIGGAALQIIILPLRLLLVWLVYGLVAYLVARLLGGRGNLGALLACTALAVGPQLLNLLSFFPYVVIGGAVGAWTLLSRYVAVKTSQQLSWGRALLATVVPYLLFYLLLAILIFVASLIVSALFAGGASS